MSACPNRDVEPIGTDRWINERFVLKFPSTLAILGRPEELGLIGPLPQRQDHPASDEPAKIQEIRRDGLQLPKSKSHVVAGSSLTVSRAACYRPLPSFHARIIRQRDGEKSSSAFSRATRGRTIPPVSRFAPANLPRRLPRRRLLRFKTASRNLGRAEIKRRRSSKGKGGGNADTEKRRGRGDFR